MSKLHGLYQERDTTSIPFLSAFLHISPSATETTTVTMKQIVFTTMYLHEYDPRDKTERWRGQSKQRLQRLVQSVENFLASTAPAFILGSVIGHKDILATCELQKRPIHSAAVAEDSEFATGSLDEEYISPVEWLQKPRHVASYVGTT